MLSFFDFKASKKYNKCCPKTINVVRLLASVEEIEEIWILRVNLTRKFLFCTCDPLQETQKDVTDFWIYDVNLIVFLRENLFD